MSRFKKEMVSPLYECLDTMSSGYSNSNWTKKYMKLFLDVFTSELSSGQGRGTCEEWMELMYFCKMKALGCFLDNDEGEGEIPEEILKIVKAIEDNKI